MSGQGTRSEEGHDTSLICQELYACNGSEEAAFECNGCKTCLPCTVRCEFGPHNREQAKNHERVQAGPGRVVPQCNNCNGGSGSLDYVKRHMTVVCCHNCTVSLCQDCQKGTHIGGKENKHGLNRYPLPGTPAEVDSAPPSSAQAADEIRARGEKLLQHASSFLLPSSAQAFDETRARGEKLLQHVSSFLLVNGKDEMQIRDEAAFLKKLHCEPGLLLKVVSVFGKTGEGKSHTLNHTFFAGREVFKTSQTQESCTAGVWAAFDPIHRVVVIDTEGLQGNVSKQGQRTRLLLKVLAISDLIVYRTCADRLHDDLFRFLGDASDAYLKHFPLSTPGPAVIIFHETVHTDLLGPSESAVRLLSERFKKLGHSPKAFSSVQYHGTQTLRPPTDFRGLQNKLEQLLDDNTSRSHRTPGAVFEVLQALSDRFNGEIADGLVGQSCFFPDEYFACSSTCLSCGSGCENRMNHLEEGICHDTQQRCRYSAQHDNCIYTCKACYEEGKDVVVVSKTSASGDSPWMGLAKYAWSGYVVECSNCGVIYRSRQFWYGNQDPVETAVRTEIQHIWPGFNGFLKDNTNAGQRLLDEVNSVAQSVSEISVKPAKAVTSWLTDQIAPAYWKPNSLVVACHKCKAVFQDNDAKHHCRACGEGFCDGCSSKAAPVPEKGWGPDPVRICNVCFEKRAPRAELLRVKLRTEEGGGTLARRFGETVTNTLGAVVTAIDVPLGLVKDAARPAYWVPDQDIVCCHNCRSDFSAMLSKHHCRACGQGVCDDCSPDRRAVPSRGWDHPVRVCIGCNQKPGDL